ncbi:MAG: uroporphyrinogen decarboxylase [Gammaproteobacteria bacterium]|nr:uroporphyrinogen decarboxylase [Gammaproteobacteria bacterium]
MTSFLKACRGEKTDYTPIWLNRQAGRYMPEYHKLKGNRSSLEFFTNPELAAQAALDAQRILDVDAAIVFADLLPILIPMGLKLDYVAGVGPVIDNPIRDPKDVDALQLVPAQEGTGYIAETVRNILQELPSRASLIGFAGAPFTLAAYAIEGRGSQNYTLAKRFMYKHPESWFSLLDKLSLAVRDYLNLQINSGVHAVQVFDSWVGCLASYEYFKYVAPATKSLFSGIHSSVPKIYFATGNQHLLVSMYETGPDFLALDWRVPMASTWEKIGCPAIQGNMDPIALCADPELVLSHAKRILDDVGGRPGHIFNLGHGIVPQTPVDNVKLLVDYVHSVTR